MSPRASGLLSASLFLVTVAGLALCMLSLEPTRAALWLEVSK